MTAWPLAVHGDFPDIEAVVMDVLAENVVIDGAPLGASHVATRPPAEIELPFIHVFRALSVGGMNVGGWEDTASVYIATWAGTRRESYELIKEVRRVFTAFVRGGSHKGVLIDAAFESSAPASSPEDDSDERRVESGWTWIYRRHTGPTIYP